MRATTKITVTKEDIRKGIKKQAGSCPLARAGERALGFPVIVSVGKMIAYRRDLPTIEIELPYFARLWYLDFDRDCPMEPITFEVSYYTKE